uniref:Uncharacterized protein n=1 Tax=Lotus japonicus TaxID=34305 RepID=I3SC13_LOTJA|nr:unknown [Lotus japonicus]
MQLSPLLCDHQIRPSTTVSAAGSRRCRRYHHRCYQSYSSISYFVLSFAAGVWNLQKSFFFPRFSDLSY